jgi:hypothetical protein
MNTKSKMLRTLALIALAAGFFAVDTSAQQIECSSKSGSTTSVTNPAGHVITTRYQLDNPDLQVLLRTRINTKPGCIVAHLSGITRITDNYVVYQVRVDGVPMQGHLPGLPGFTTPVVFVSIDSAGPGLDDEQYIDPTKVTSYNFFDRVSGGNHVVEVLAAGGSNIIAGSEPSVVALVLTLEYQ